MKRRSKLFTALLCILLMLLATACKPKALTEAEIREMIAGIVSSDLPGYALTEFTVTDRQTDLEENTDRVLCTMTIENEFNRTAGVWQLNLSYQEDNDWQLTSTDVVEQKHSPLVGASQADADAYMAQLASAMALTSFELVDHQTDWEDGIPWESFTYKATAEAAYASFAADFVVWFGYDVQGGTGWVLQAPYEAKNEQLVWNLGGTYQFVSDRRNGNNVGMIETYTLSVDGITSDGMLLGNYLNVLENYYIDHVLSSRDTQESGPWTMRKAEDNVYQIFPSYTAIIDGHFFLIDANEGVRFQEALLGSPKPMIKVD